MENSLRKLRKEAGFTSAAKFAEHIGIPAPTYARYEQTEDGPETSMPIKNAWLIADALGCSIDHVVGRKHVDTSEMRGEVQKFYDGLAGETKDLFNDFMEFAALRDQKVRAKHKRRIDSMYRRRVEDYLRKMFKKAATDDHYASVVTFGSQDDIRSAFEKFVREEEASISERLARDAAKSVRRDASKQGFVKLHESDGATKKIYPGDPLYDDLVEAAAEATYEDYISKDNAKREEVMKKIMQAYDSMREKSSDGVPEQITYHFVTTS